MLPFWLALAASAALHVGVLLSPGWNPPLTDAFDMPPGHVTLLDATLATAQTVVAKAPAAVRAAPARKRMTTKPAPPPAAADSPAPVPAKPELAEAAPTEEPPLAPPAAPDEAHGRRDAVPPAPTFTQRWPRRGRIVFQVSRGSDGFVIGQGEQSWQHDGEHYSLHAKVETTGLAALFRSAKVIQESRGVFDATGLRPLEFSTQRTGKPKETIRFEPQEKQVVFVNGERAPLPEATQDLLSLFYQLGGIDAGPAPFAVDLALGRRVSRYLVRVERERWLDSFLGPRPVLHLTVSAGVDADTTEIWLDMETRLPLKIRHRDRKGEVFDQTATAVELDNLQ